MPINQSGGKCGYAGESSYFGCSGVFPRSELADGAFCHRCARLYRPGLTAEALVLLKKSLEDETQCGECGLIGVCITDPCGTCKREAHAENGKVDPERAESAAARGTSMKTRIGNGRANVFANDITNSTQLSRNGPATPEAELNDIRINRTRSAFTILYQIRQSEPKGGINNAMGHSSLVVETSETMLEVREKILEAANAKWVKLDLHCIPIEESETELRFKGNRTFADTDMHLTVSRFYGTYSNRADRELFLPSGRVKGVAKGTFMEMELYVMMGRYTRRTEKFEVIDSDESDPDVGKGKGKGKQSKSKKRKSANDDDDYGDYPAKRAASGAQPLVSAFARQDGRTRSVSAKDPRAPLLFCRLTAEIKDIKTMEVSTSLATVAERGEVAIKPLVLSAKDRGRSKEVYDLRIAGDCHSYVAKRLVWVADHEAVEDLASARAFLELDLERLVRGAAFARRFHSLAFKSGVLVQDFKFTEAFVALAFEAEEAEPVPSVTDRDSRLVEHGSSMMGDPDERALLDVCLVEPKRTSTKTRKFTGTMANEQWTDLVSATINAFAHFVAADSACEYVLTDLQGSYNSTEEGTELVLFDPMSHTPNGKSGTGDFGLEGIDSFINTHVCAPICRQLALASKETLRVTASTLEIDV